jgi:hypothetical protein
MGTTIDGTSFSVVTRGKDDCWGNVSWFTVARFCSGDLAERFAEEYSREMHVSGHGGYLYYVRVKDEHQPSGFRTISGWYNGKQT